MAKTGKFGDLRRRLVFLVLALVVYRIGAHIPVPGIDPNQLQQLFQGQAGGILSLFNMFSGGALSRFTVFALGIMPYISASIIMQLMTYVVPSLEALKKEGEAGRRKINQWTRLITVPLAIIQSIAFIFILRQTVLAGNTTVLNSATPVEWVVAVTAMTAGAVLLMWLGELITEQGMSLAEALEVQRTELQGWRLGELLVHLGFVDRQPGALIPEDQRHPLGGRRQQQLRARDKAFRAANPWISLASRVRPQVNSFSMKSK